MEYGMLLMFIVFAIVFVVAALIVNRLVMPHNPTKEKNMIYECGVDPQGDAHVRYNIRFYVFALMYVIFAVEAEDVITFGEQLTEKVREALPEVVRMVSMELNVES